MPLASPSSPPAAVGHTRFGPAIAIAVLIAAEVLLTGCAGGKKMGWQHEPMASSLSHPSPLPAPPIEPPVDTVVERHGQGGGLLPDDGARQRYLSASTGDAADNPRRDSRPVTLEWPLAATGVTSLFGPRRDPLDGGSRFHYGLDLEAPYGTIVGSCAPGVVIDVGWNHGHGRQVTVEHPGGYRTSYSHLSLTLVEPGARVTGGHPVGLVGNSGRSTGPHLHLEITQHGTYVDPLEVLGVAVE